MPQDAPRQDVGIDVSKDRLEVAIQIDDLPPQHLSFANTRTGHRQLRRRLTKKRRSARVTVESTNTYHLDLAYHLAAAPQIEIQILTPDRLTSFSKAQGTRAKTDRSDAATALEFTRRMKFEPWTPPETELGELRSLTRRVRQLNEEKTREESRLQNLASEGVSPAVCKDLREHIEHLKQRIQGLRTAARELVGERPDLAAEVELHCTVPGIGEKSSLDTVAELLHMPNDLSTRQCVAYTGLDPKVSESGKTVSKKRKISKKGSRYLRAALYMPALAAIQHDPHFRAFYDKLLARGKHKRTALTAVMRKLLHALWAMHRTQMPYDGDKLFPGILVSG